MDSGVAGGSIGIGAAIAVLIALVKSAFPALPSRMIPLIVAGMALVFVVALAFSTGTRDPLTLLLTWVAQIGTTMGAREGFVAVVPGASDRAAGAGNASAAPVVPPA